MNKRLLSIPVIVFSAVLTIIFITPALACDFEICKFNDLNGNGIQDAGEPNISGWLIRIYDDTDVLVAEGTTGSDGCINFYVGIAGITYHVWEEQVECWEPTAPPSLLFYSGGYYIGVPTSNGSSHFIQFGNKYVCNGGGEGCTPGYWRNHLEDWAATGYSPDDDFDTTFGVDLFDPDITLGQAVWAGGGGANKMARHGTAALLSAAHPDVDYPYTVAQVIALLMGGDIDLLVGANELGCDIR